MLTKKQHDLLLYLNAEIVEHGICPSFEEMRMHLGLKSKSGIAGLIIALELRGFIRRHKNSSRAIEIVRLPEDAAQNQQETQTHFISIPFFGQITAGSPLFDQDRQPGPGNDHILIPENYCKGKGNHYALTVLGDSMTGLGIFDGDLAIMEHTYTAKNGDIISALIDNSEITLKTYQRVPKKIHLIPANPNFRTQIYDPDRVIIHGRLTAILRKYT